MNVVLHEDIHSFSFFSSIVDLNMSLPGNNLASKTVVIKKKSFSPNLKIKIKALRSFNNFKDKKQQNISETQHSFLRILPC